MKMTDIPEIAQLNVSEKILLVEDIWESIISDEESVSIPQSHEEEIKRRYLKYKSNPGSLLSLEQLQKRIERRK